MKFKHIVFETMLIIYVQKISHGKFFDIQYVQIYRMVKAWYDTECYYCLQLIFCRYFRANCVHVFRSDICTPYLEKSETLLL